MTDRELMQQALHTLEGWANHGEWVWPESALEQAKRNTTESIAALRERLAQPEQEPVAWVYPEGLEALKIGRPWTAYGSSGEGRIPLYLNDAVARRAEPRLDGSGAGFESLPASPTQQEPVFEIGFGWLDDATKYPRGTKLYAAPRQWQGLTDDEKQAFVEWAHPDIIDTIEFKLRTRNS